MATTLVNFRLDESVKTQMEAVCAEIGISMSAAFNIYARTVARNGRIPFELSSTPTPPPHLNLDINDAQSLADAVNPALKDVENQRTLTHTEALDYLQAHGISISGASAAL